VILAGGLALRCSGLVGRGLWLDEGYSWWVASHSLGEIAGVCRGDTAPPLYYLLLHTWVAMFGDAEWMMRALSVLAGVTSIALAGAVAAKLYGGRMVTLATMLLAAVMPLQVAWSQETRCYALLSATLLLAFLGLACARQGITARRWALCVLGALASVYLHNIAWFYLAAFALAFLLMPGEERLKKRMRFLVTAYLAVIVLYLPWVPALLDQLRFVGQNYAEGRPAWGDLLLQLALSGGFSVGQTFRVAPYLNAGYVVLLLCAICVLLARPGNAKLAMAAALAALLPVLMLWGYSEVGKSIFIMPRVGIPAAALLPVVLAAGLTGTAGWQKAVGGAVLLAMVAIGAPGAWAGPDRREDWPAATKVINANAREGVKLIFLANEGELLYDYYCHRSGQTPSPATGLPARFEDGRPPRCLMRVNSATDLTELERVTSDAAVQRIVLVLTHEKRRDPNGLAEAFLVAGWRKESLLATQRLNIIAFDRVAAIKP
jgi:4-amino-4-deoxy-L-arabinose transferase-like glycosyltransferase